MNRFALSAAALVAALIAAPAISHADDVHCTNAPQSQWRSMADAKSAAEQLGYQVRGVKIEDSCFEVKGLSKSGRRTELYMDPVSLKVVRTKDKS